MYIAAHLALFLLLFVCLEPLDFDNGANLKHLMIFKQNKNLVSLANLASTKQIYHNFCSCSLLQFETSHFRRMKFIASSPILILYIYLKHLKHCSCSKARSGLHGLLSSPSNAPPCSMQHTLLINEEPPDWNHLSIHLSLWLTNPSLLIDCLFWVLTMRRFVNAPLHACDDWHVLGWKMTLLWSDISSTFACNDCLQNFIYVVWGQVENVAKGSPTIKKNSKKRWHCPLLATPPP